MFIHLQILMLYISDIVDYLDYLYLVFGNACIQASTTDCNQVFVLSMPCKYMNNVL